MIFFSFGEEQYELELFVWTLNEIEHWLQFTLEVEMDSYLPFLDVGIMKENGKLLTKVYRKPTHTQQYINWVSNHPKKYVVGGFEGFDTQSPCAM